MDDLRPLLQHVVAVRLLALDALRAAGSQTAHDVGEAAVEFRGLLGRTGDDERRARLIDQDVVYLVDNGVVKFRLHTLAQIAHHVVA
jgi:hypothetical protein